MSQMATIHQTRYPRAYAFLLEELAGIKGEATIWNAFLENSHLDAGEAQAALKLGDGPPLIFASNLGSAVWGQFNIDVPGRIEISVDVLKYFEADPGNALAQRFLRAKVLHEMCHWGCFRKQVPDDDEAGEKFEVAAFQKELRPWWVDSVATEAAAVAANTDFSIFTDAGARARALREMLVQGKKMPGRLVDPAHKTFAGVDVSESQPRGFRNNNAGNIRVGEAWDGLADPLDQMEFQRREQNFCVFREPEWGLRAMAVILRNYKKKYGLDTPQKIISRWAPASDNNDVDSYSRQLANAIGVTPGTVIAIEDSAVLERVMWAIAKHENGDTPPCTAVQFQAAIALADRVEVPVVFNVPPVTPEGKAIDALDLAPSAKAAAIQLLAWFPNDVRFTSGRRSVADQARAMAQNVVKKRHWIEETYKDTGQRAALQAWVNQNPAIADAASIAAGLEPIMRPWTDVQKRNFSRHMSGDAFDVLPMPGTVGQRIKDSIPNLSKLKWHTFEEGGLERWHVEINP